MGGWLAGDLCLPWVVLVICRVRKVVASPAEWRSMPPELQVRVIPFLGGSTLV